MASRPWLAATAAAPRAVAPMIGTPAHDAVTATKRTTYKRVWVRGQREDVAPMRNISDTLAVWRRPKAGWSSSRVADDFDWAVPATGTNRPQGASEETPCGNDVLIECTGVPVRRRMGPGSG